MKALLAVSAITVVALLLRCWTADWSLTADEANGVAIAVTGSWSDMIQHLRADGNPPLFYALVRLYSLLFSSSDLSLKLLCIAMSTSLVPASFFLLRPIIGGTTALQSATLIALCPTLIRYGNMVRMYALFPLLGLLSTTSAISFLFQPKRATAWIYVLSTTLLVYCHHWAFFLIFGQGIFALICILRKWCTASAFYKYLGYSLLVALAYLPWLFNLLFTLGHNESPWAAAPTLSHLLIETPPEALIGKLTFRNSEQELLMMYATFWVGFVYLFSKTGWTGSAPSERIDAFRYIVGLGVVAALLVSAVKPAWRDRYLVVFTPLFLTSFCISLKPFTSSLRYAIACIAPVLLWLPVWPPILYSLSQSRESSVAAFVDQIKTEARPGKDLVVVSWEAEAPALSRAVPQDIDLVSFPDLERTQIIRWEGLNDRICDDQRLQELFARIRQVLDAGGTIWLIDSAHATHSVGEPGQFLLRYFDFATIEGIRMDQIRAWLKQNSHQEGVFLWGPGRDASMFMSIYKPLLRSPQ